MRGRRRPVSTGALRINGACPYQKEQQAMLRRIGFALVILLALVGDVRAQGDGGSLRGRVVDQSGAVLPGVTVTASSPAVMGGSLTTVTSAEGLYRFPLLPPGLYEIRMQLEGFRPISVPGLRINVGLGLTIDEQMTVAAVDEALTVVGEAPIVDTRHTSGQSTWTTELLERIPSARDLWSTMQQVPGLVMGKENVGGIESPFLSHFSVHGSVQGQHQYNFNGIDMSDMHSGIGLGYFNTDSMEEIQFTSSGISAEHSRGGLILNTVTKTGSNAFNGQVATYFENSALQSTNIDADLRARGVSGTGAPLDYLLDVSGTIGGPIKTDHLWFFAAVRQYSVYPFVLNCTLPGGGQCQDGVRLPNVTGRLTGQTDPSNRFMLMYDRGHIIRPNRGVSQFTSLEASFNETFHYDMWQLKYDRILGSNAVMQASVGRGSPPFSLGYHETVEPGVSTAFDEITRVRFGAASIDFFQQGDILVFNGNMTYFRDRWAGASHDVKLGVEHRRGKLQQRHRRAGDHERRFQNGVPYRVIAFNSPVEQVARNFGMAAFAQDSVRLGDRVTLNLGARVEWWRGDVPEQSNQPSSFADVFGGGSTFPEQKGVMEWTNLSPRLGVVYDVAGNSRTVLKASYGRYYFQIRSTDLNAFANPNGLATATFEWTDLNGNNMPDYPGEFGRLVSLNLPRLRSIDPGLTAPFSDEVTVSAEQAVSRSAAVTVRYTYRKNNKMTATTDLALPDSAFSIPSTATDPLTGQPIQYYSLAPEFRTVTNQEVLSQFDDNWTRYHGVDFVFNRRFDGRWLFNGSVTLQDNYGRVGGFMNRNDDEIHAYGAAGLDARVVVKMATTWALPWDLSGSLFFRHTGGMNANNFSNQMARVVQVRDVTTNSLYALRVEESGALRQDGPSVLDLRLARAFRFGTRKLDVILDGFNMTNANNVLSTGVITGSDLGVPLRLITPRVFRIGVRLDF